MQKKFAPIIIANWKMNGVLLESMQFLKALRMHLHQSLVGCEIVLCPPYTLLRDFAEKIPGTGMRLGGQNCHHELDGAYTGEISARQLKDMTCDYVLLGHSERRLSGSEGSELVQKKATAAYAQKLIAIICVGETQYERDNNLTNVVIREQLLHSIPANATSANTIIAYEPVWAIGSGLTPTQAEILSTHTFIQETIKTEKPHLDAHTRIIYGGSVSSGNANALLKISNVDGLLIGKASLNVEQFWTILNSM
jgi:triosephosphate isomerase (TIM)